MTMNEELQASEAERLEAAGLWLMRLQDEALTEAEMVEWLEWYERDPANAAAFEHLQSLWQAAGAHPPRQLLRRRRARSALWPALAASLVAVLVTGALFALRPQWLETDRTATRDIVHTRIAHNRQLRLPDGSHADVGAGSVVSIDFAGPKRRVQLRDGEVFFQVAHDARKPFIVELDGVEIVAIGTAFNVRRAAWQLAVTVTEGSVEVRQRGAAPGITAAAGGQVVIDTRSGQVRESRIDPALALAWRSGRLEFSGDPLEVVVASVNRYAVRPIELRDSGTSDLRYTGTVALDAIEAWVDGLPEIFPVEIRHEDGYDLLTRRGSPSGP